MKTSSSLLLALTLITPTALVFSTGCSKSNSDKVADAVQDAKVAVKDAAIDVKDGAVSTWNSIKDYKYDKRSDFAAGIDKATKSMDDKLAELKAKATADTPEKTKAREEYDEDFRRDYLGWHVHYHLASDEKRGIAKFSELLQKHGLGPVYEPKYVS